MTRSQRCISLWRTSASLKFVHIWGHWRDNDIWVSRLKQWGCCCCCCCCCCRCRCRCRCCGCCCGCCCCCCCCCCCWISFTNGIFWNKLFFRCGGEVWNTMKCFPLQMARQTPRAIWLYIQRNQAGTLGCSPLQYGKAEYWGDLSRVDAWILVDKG